MRAAQYVAIVAFVLSAAGVVHQPASACSPYLPRLVVTFPPGSAVLDIGGQDLERLVSEINPKCFVWHIDVNLDGAEGQLPPLEARELGQRRAEAVIAIVRRRGIEPEAVNQNGASRPIMGVPPGTSELQNRLTWLRAISYSEQAQGRVVGLSDPNGPPDTCGPRIEWRGPDGELCYRPTR